jgi:iron complex outermembrane receptor protein
MKLAQTLSAPTLLSLYLSCAAADTQGKPSGLSENYFLGDTPLVLSPSRLAQPITNAPAAVTVIDRELIEASGAITIPDVLRLVPGFQVSTISGANQTAQYHGLASQHPKRMQVLVDGRSVYHSAFGGVHWDTLPFSLEDIERIEVTRGSNASAYGSNSFMGVINIVTRHASQDRGNQFNLLTGYNNTHEAEWRHGGKHGNLDYRFTLSAFTTDGFPDYTGTHDWWDSTGVIPARDVLSFTPFVGEINQRTLGREDDQQIARFNFRGDYLFGNGDSLLAETGYVHNDRENSLIKGAFDELRPGEALRSSFQLLKWTRQTGGEGELSLQISHSRLDFDGRHVGTYILVDKDNDLIFNLGPVKGGYQFRNDRYDLELQHTLPGMDGWRTAWGLGVRLDLIEGENLFIDDADEERLQLRLFANTEKQFGEQDQWVFNAGLMLEHYADLGLFASPRLALNHHLNDHFTLRIAASRAYRMPSFAEQYNESALYALDPPGFVSPTPYHYVLNSNRGNDDVDPEELTSYEIGIVSADWIEGLSFDVRLFHEELRNFINNTLYRNGCDGCDSSPPAFSPHDIHVVENTGWMDIDGAELQVRYSPSNRTTLVFAASRTNASGVSNDAREAEGTLIPGKVDQMDAFIPELTASALLSHRFDQGWSGSVGYYRMSEMDWPEEGDALDSYERWDLRLAKHLRLDGNDLQAELIVHNLFDKTYQEFRHQNDFERRAYIRLKLDIH